MFIIRGLVAKSKYCSTLLFKFNTSRALNSKAEIIPKTSETVQKPKERRFVKPETTRELKPFDANFVVNLFKGECNKEIFEYPLIFERDELSCMIRHSIEMENFLNKNLNIEINKNTVEEFKKLELFGLSSPKQYGGAGYSLTETKFMIECCGANPSVGRFLGYCDDIGCRLISTFGTEEQKEKYLPKLASGESKMTLAYLETGPLVDFSSFEGAVIKDYENNGFLINAQKKWVHNAHVSDLILVLAKSSVIHEDTDEYNRIGFDFFITEKTAPGVSLYQLTSGCAKDFNLYEVDFKNVFVPKENQLGNDQTIGHVILQTALLHRELTDAVICLSVIKRIINSALHYCEGKIINELPIKNFEYIQINMAYLSSYAYALESVIYLITARFDSHIEPNLFYEGILVKVFSVDMLQVAIQKYIQILGHDSFKKCEILEEALKTLHYCNIFDENNTHLKLIISTAGIMNVKPSMITLVKKLRKKYDYPVEAIKHAFSFRPKKISELDSKLGIKGELNSVLSQKGDILEMCLGKLKMGMENHIIKYGNTAIEDEFTLVKYAEMVTYVYALAATLSRASTAYCYDLKNSEDEINIACLVADIIEAKFEQLANEAENLLNFSNCYREVGKLSFANKEYPAEHPLSRAF